MSLHVEVDKHRISNFCREHRIRRLAFFGSVLRKDFRSDSDVDVLVEFEPGQEPGLMRLARKARDLSEIIGRQADLRTPEDLSHLFRDEVMASAEVEYAA